MSIENRYDALLGDILTLFQQALFRFMTNQEVDLTKFKHYFLQFNKSMNKIEEEFHPSRLKMTQCLTKLHTICTGNKKGTKFSLDLTPSNTSQKQSQHSYKSRSFSKQRKTSSLNVIGEVQQDYIPQPKLPKQLQTRKRSETAGGSRPNIKNFSVDFENGRPLTGERIQVERYGTNPQGNYHTLMVISSEQPRRSFYDQLEQLDRYGMVSENVIKIPQKRNISQQRKSFKINKLF